MRDHLVFYLNGERRQAAGAQAGQTLTDYLRQPHAFASRGALCGTKVACSEGDCGACTVLVGRPNAAGDKLVYQTIDACIAFVYQMDGAHVVTVEGIGRAGRLSRVQQAMVDCHGSQCGFCTPGFVMALHGLLENQPPGRRLTDDQLRLGLTGNLCRCTGYEQILEAAREAFGANGQSLAERYDSPELLAELVQLNRDQVLVNARSDAGQNGAATNGAPRHETTVEVAIPATLKQLVAWRAARPDATLVAGATDLGVQHNHGKITPRSVILTTRVAELNELRVEPDAITIGAAVPWSRVEQAVRDKLPEYFNILQRFGSPQVRHAGTLGGNLANASPIADSIPLHYVTRTTVTLAGPSGMRDLAIEDFYLGYKQLALRPDEVIASIRTPLPPAGVLLKLYKVSKRRDMDISTVTAAFWIEVDDDQITAARVALGGVGPTVIRAPQAEAALVARPFSLATFAAAGKTARGEVTPLSDVRGAAAYRLQLVENLFLKCWHDLSSAGRPAPAPA